MHTCMPVIHTCMYSTSTMKIVGVSTISRGEHHVAQTRELECIKVVVPQALLEVGFKVRAIHVYKALHISIHSPGLKIVDDMQLAVGRYMKQDLKLLNSFDTWHGMKLTAMVCSVYVCIGATIHRVGIKNVAKERTKITKGRVIKGSRCDLVY